MGKWLYPAAVVATTGVFWFAGHKPCVAHILVVNASGNTLTGIQVEAPGAESGQSPATLASGASQEFLFPEFTEGSYSLRFIDADGSRIEDTQGYLVPGTAFDDTLSIQSPADSKRFVIRQTPASCKEPFHWRAFLRRFLRNL
ncbi:MAG: hypothetical protein ABIY63_16220 [Fibrobacteria bacterium]